ncbi:hypothetical protein EEL32_00270 (plasmid) [Brevibacillus laterosporus]|nr:hypothetical protein [Brevibacillus laterosporus]TPG93526.1 hypothetical protein EEL32_00270 [Brevibacillus laterosporus]
MYGIKQTGLNVGYDTETGEKLIKQEIWLRNKQIAKVVDVSNRKNIKHIKFRSSTKQKRIYSQLTSDEASLLFKLMPYMSWETNLIVGDGVLGEKNKPLKWSQVDQLLDYSKRQRIKVVKLLEEKKLIGYYVIGGKRTGIVINPSVAINGYKPDETLCKVFESDHDVGDDAEEEGAQDAPF